MVHILETLKIILLTARKNQRCIAAIPNRCAAAHKGVVSMCQGSNQFVNALLFKPIWLYRGAAKYLQNLVRVPRTKKGWETLVHRLRPVLAWCSQFVDKASDIQNVKVPKEIR